MKTCDDCKYAGVQITPDKSLNKICRRRPPIPYTIAIPQRTGAVQIQIISAWPGITEDDYCGDFEGRLAS